MLNALIGLSITGHVLYDFQLSTSPEAMHDDGAARSSPEIGDPGPRRRGGGGLPQVAAGTASGGAAAELSQALAGFFRVAVGRQQDD